MKHFARFNEMRELGFFKDRTAEYRLRRQGAPPPIELGPNSIAWDVEAYGQWFESRPRRTPKSPGDPTAVRIPRGEGYGPGRHRRPQPTDTPAE